MERAYLRKLCASKEPADGLADTNACVLVAYIPRVVVSNCGLPLRLRLGCGAL